MGGAHFTWLSRFELYGGSHLERGRKGGGDTEAHKYTLASSLTNCCKTSTLCLNDFTRSGSTLLERKRLNWGGGGGGVP